ncbi:MAG: glycosyltransferase family 4 protein [Halobaculum sp.]
MRATYVSAASPLDPGGPSNTAEVWLDELAAAGVETTVITRSRAGGTREVDGVTYYEYSDYRPGQEIENRLAEIGTDVVLTESAWADLAVRAARNLGIGSVMNVMSPSGANDRFEQELQPTRFTACSEYSQQWIGRVWGRDSTLAYPTIDFEFYTVEDRDPTYTSMITPIQRKGGAVFRSLAEAEPDREFMTKTGWHAVRNDDGSWDRELLLAGAKSFADEPGEISLDDVVTPTEIDLHDLDNVTYAPPRAIRKVYRECRVLLEPAQWPQAFSRVAVEAMWNGIPVIASNRGGIPEACGDGAVRVEDHDDPDAWRDALEVLDDPDRYRLFSRRAERRARRYRDAQADQVDRLLSVARDAAAEGVYE